MARRTETIEHFVDDIDGSPAEESISFSLDGTTYLIDLNKKNAKALRSDLQKWIALARKESAGRGRRTTGRAASPARGRGRSTRSTRPTRSRGASTGPDARQIRAWAAEQGLDVPSRGRLPSAVVEQYVAAHG